MDGADKARSSSAAAPCSSTALDARGRRRRGGRGRRRRCRPTRPVTFTREDPPCGGPAAGLLAGLRRAAARPPDRSVVLAVDMPRVTPATFAPAARGGGRPRRRVPGRRRRAGGSWRGVVARRGARSTRSGPTTRSSTGCRCTGCSRRLDLADVPAGRRRGPRRRHLGRPARPAPSDLTGTVADGVAGLAERSTEIWVREPPRLDRRAVRRARRRDRGRRGPGPRPGPDRRPQRRPAGGARSRRTCSGYAAGAQGANPEADRGSWPAARSALAEGWDRPADARTPTTSTTRVPDDSRVDHTGDTLRGLTPRPSRAAPGADAAGHASRHRRRARRPRGPVRRRGARPRARARRGAGRRRRHGGQPRRPAAAAGLLPAAARRLRRPRPGVQRHRRRARRGRRAAGRSATRCARCSPAVGTPSRSPSRPAS